MHPLENVTKVSTIFQDEGVFDDIPPLISAQSVQHVGSGVQHTPLTANTDVTDSVMQGSKLDDIEALIENRIVNGTQVRDMWSIWSEMSIN